MDTIKIEFMISGHGDHNEEANFDVKIAKINLLYISRKERLNMLINIINNIIELDNISHYHKINSVEVNKKYYNRYNSINLFKVLDNKVNL
jgi:hypothetical protein